MNIIDFWLSKSLTYIVLIKNLWKFNFQIASFYFEFDETCKLVKIGENQFESCLFHEEIFLLKIFRGFFGAISNFYFLI